MLSNISIYQKTHFISATTLCCNFYTKYYNGCAFSFSPGAVLKYTFLEFIFGHQVLPYYYTAGKHTILYMIHYTYSVDRIN